MHVSDVFQDTSTHPFLKKVQEYHDETGNPIELSMKRKKKPHCPQEKQLLRGIQQNLLPHHIDMIRQYIPPRAHKTARETFLWSQYHEIKQRIAFIENAVQQIQEYDPFYLTMDDIHGSDMMLTELISAMIYYREMVANTIFS